MDEYNRRILRLFEEAQKEPDDFLKTLQMAFCLVMVEDKKLLEELAKK